MAHLEAAQQHLLQEVAEQLWPGVTFTCTPETRLERTCIAWEDGPTDSEFRRRIDAHLSLDWDQVIFHRTISLLTWALIRGPQVPPTEIMPAATAQALLGMGARSQPDRIEAYLDLINQSLPPAQELAQDARHLARAETAVALGEPLTYHKDHVEFDVWLYHGGWQLACTLNP